jgi:7-carboxy-7-deazaguanine synthase
MLINSIFQSINGEVCAQHQGSICTFIRLQGCNLCCPYCDTPDSQSFEKGENWNVKDVFNLVRSLPIKTRNITITGGEPLMQAEELVTLVNLFKGTEEGWKISVETNGSLRPISSIKNKVSWVMDCKNHYPKEVEFVFNALQLTKKDWVKFMVQSEKDFYAALKMANYLSGAYSPVKQAWSAVLPMTPQRLFELLAQVENGNAVLNVQLHKLLNLP